MTGAWDLQKAVYAALKGSVALTGLGVSVFDHVPQDAEFPYIVLGDESGSEFDTDDTFGTEFDLQIDTWNRYRGKKETKAILSAIWSTLHRSSLSVDGATVVLFEFTRSSHFLDADGLTRHGIINFNVTLDYS